MYIRDYSSTKCQIFPGMLGKGAGLPPPPSSAMMDMMNRIMTTDAPNISTSLPIPLHTKGKYDLAMNTVINHEISM